VVRADQVRDELDDRSPGHLRATAYDRDGGEPTVAPLDGQRGAGRARQQALGYSITNSDGSDPVFPSIGYTGRRFDDPSDLLQGEQVILNGTSSLGGNGSFGIRWGDYS